MRTKSLIGILIALIALGVVVFNLPKPPYSPSPQTNDSSAILSDSTLPFQPTTTQDSVPASIILVNTPETTTTPLETSGPIATLSTGEELYSVPIHENTNVLNAMRTLASTSDFAFTGHDYPSLGFFVESLNGKKNADGFYWFLYVNGKESLKGASQTALNSGDIVEWRYKKGY